MTKSIPLESAGTQLVGLSLREVLWAVFEGFVTMVPFIFSERNVL